MAQSTITALEGTDAFLEFVKGAARGQTVRSISPSLKTGPCWLSSGITKPQGRVTMTQPPRFMTRKPIRLSVGAYPSAATRIAEDAELVR